MNAQNTNPNALAKPAQRSIQTNARAEPATLQTFLGSRREEIAKVLPKHVSFDRLAKTAALAVAKTPQLQEASIRSVYAAVLTLAELGLEPNTPTGHAYLVPFKNKGVMECTPIIGYRGLIDLARRGGELEQIEAHVVYERDRYEIEFGLDPKLRHVPYMGTEARGGIVLAYMVARLKGGGVHVEAMTKGEIDAIRATSKTGGSAASPWASHYAEMAKKTVIRRGAKYLPMSTELAKAIEQDDEEFAQPAASVSTVDVMPAQPAEPKTSKAKRLAAELAPKVAEPAHDAETGEVVEEPSDEDLADQLSREPGEEG